MANGTIGGIGAAAIALHAQSSVPSPPSVVTKSIVLASAAGHSPAAASAALIALAGAA